MAATAAKRGTPGFSPLFAAVLTLRHRSQPPTDLDSGARSLSL